MEFLEGLYEIENFGIYLFVIIGILVVLFLVVLFFGKKDQKKRKIEKVEEVITPPTIEEYPFKEETVPVKVEVPVSNNPVFETTNPEIPNIETVEPSSNVVLNSDFIAETPEAVEVPEKSFDFDALADAISKELETDYELPIKEPVIENTVKEVEPKEVEESRFTAIPNEVYTPSIEPVPTVEPVENMEVKPRPVMPTVFSSVYVNREKEEIKPPVIETPVRVEEPVETSPVQLNTTVVEEISTPEKPEFELPKMVDLPKKVEMPSPVIEEKKEDNIFPSI